MEDVVEDGRELSVSSQSESYLKKCLFQLKRFDK